MKTMSKKHLNTRQITQVAPTLLSKMVADALTEDMGEGDVNALLINENEKAQAQVVTREAMTVCGRAWVDEVFRQIDSEVKLIWRCDDGEKLLPNALVFEAIGLARSILSAERGALNFLQMLSGVATMTRSYVDAVAGTSAEILDTRKSIPGFRLAQKYAVKCGGGVNHRIGLFDAFLIKENHIASCGHSITEAVKRARLIAPQKLIEVEVENFDELDAAMKAEVDVIMLDNFSLNAMQKAVKTVAGKIPLEASGNVSIETVRTIAETGVDFISVGALTKHIKAIDLSMRFV